MQTVNIKRTTTILICLLLVCPLVGFAAPKSKLIPIWNQSNENSVAVIDHSRWQTILDRYLDASHSSGINRFNYGGVSAEHKRLLSAYVNDMQSIDPKLYARIEQKSYWINLYNALTVKLIIDNYPVKSIKKTGKGFFSFGPWDDKIATIEDQELSLNDIEHGILRPIWQDNRIHYAVNCASLGCPNLLPKAYTAGNSEELLEQAATAYVNHQRGVHFDNKQLIISSIYDWYRVDFGSDNKNVIMHLMKYASPQLKDQLANYQGDIDYSYDWSLNSN